MTMEEKNSLEVSCHSRNAQTFSSTKKNIVVQNGVSSAKKKGPPPLTVVLNMQQEYAKHKQILEQLKELKDNFFE